MWARLWAVLNTQVVAGVLILIIGLGIGTLREPLADVFAGDIELKLNDPQPGDEIGRTPAVSGTVSNLPAGWAVWMVNRRRLGDGRYFVADGPCDVSGSEWECHGGDIVFVGGESDGGDGFALKAVAVDAKTQRKFIKYLRDQGRRGGPIPDLPASSEVPVTREPTPAR